MDTLDESEVERVEGHEQEEAESVHGRTEGRGGQDRQGFREIGRAGRPGDGLAVSALRSWVKQDEINQNPAPRGPLTTDERAELTRLRKELKRVEMERDFVKKAAAFFARET